MTFRVTLYPALDGDCILLSWGKSSRVYHILVDLGRGVTYKAIKKHLKALGDLELFVMSHVDADHIAGAIPMVREKTAPFRPRRVWYNARPQLAAAVNRNPITEEFGARQGEKLAKGIVRFGWPWNAEFMSEIVSTDSPEARDWITMADGLRVRLLSPNDAALQALLPTWDDELERARIRNSDPDEDTAPLSPIYESFGVAPPNVADLAKEEYRPDGTVANGSAIAFIAEFEGKRVLLSADAHSETLEGPLRILAEEEGGRYRLDLLKLSHHGSRANTSKSLPGMIDCTRFAVSTNGSRDHDHPHGESIARLLASDKDRHKTLYFNYRQPYTDQWDSTRLMKTWKYDCVFPAASEGDEANGTLLIDI
jgi:beta-lactamase superfamily II metal-dependent hydrolase